MGGTYHAPLIEIIIRKYGSTLHVLSIRKYGNTFYIGIAMVILAYFGPTGKLKFQFSFSVSTQLDLYHHQSGEHVES